MRNPHRASLSLALLISASLLAGNACQSRTESQEHVFSGRALGTSYTVKVAGAALGERESERIASLVEQELERVDRRMSTYREDSELSELNRARGGTAFSVSADLLQVLLAARHVGQISGGAFDITVAPLVDAWGFGPQGQPETIPSEERLAELMEQTGWQRIEINESDSTVLKSTDLVRCDLSGIAKGYAVDRVSEALSAAGYSNHMAEVGGEVKASGVNRSAVPWRIGIERPTLGPPGLYQAISLADMAMATSGDYRNYFEVHGVRYFHIIDPRTGQPIRHQLASVTVVDRTCTPADGFATALMVLGENEGYEVAVENNLAALFLVRDAGGEFTHKATPRFETLFGRTSGRPAEGAN